MKGFSHQETMITKSQNDPMILKNWIPRIKRGAD